MDSNTVVNVRRLTLIATIFALLVIALGAYTRLVHAGLGCPDWPTCYGHLWAPDSTVEIASANSAFPDAPVNLEKTWPEMTHRYLASGLGLLCIVICWLCIKIRRRQSAISDIANSADKQFPYKHSVGLLAFIILQGMFGMWTVTLKLWPQVVTLHLLGGFTTFGLLLLLYLRLSTNCPGPGQYRSTSALRKIAIVTLVVAIMQVMLGGWTTSNYAAMACLELPLCSVAQLTSDDYNQGFNFFQQLGPNYLGGQLDAGARIAIHAMHRFGALAVLILSVVLITGLCRSRHTELAVGLTGILLIQLALGVSNVYFHLPLYNAVAHNIGGALLIAVLITINYRMSQLTRQII